MPKLDSHAHSPKDQHPIHPSIKDDPDRQSARGANGPEKNTLYTRDH
jgi:hypothetical protein